MGLTEYFINRFCRVQLAVHQADLTLISKRQLVAKVVKAVVDRCSREHQYLCFHACAHHFIQQLEVSVLLLIFAGDFATVAEVVTFVNNYQIVVAPVQAIEIQTIRASLCAREIRVEQYIIAQTITGNGVVDIVVLIGIPVPCQLFRAQYKNRLVAVFIVFYYRKGGEGLAQADAIGQDAAVVFFELVDDCKHRITLEIIQHAPNLALFEPGRFVRQYIFGNVLEEFAKHIIESNEVN